MIYHGESGLTDLNCTVRKTTARLRAARTEHPFDSIILTGMSGVLVGIPVALRLKVPAVVLRKDSDNCHTSGKWIGAEHLGVRCLFLDDFTSAGGTLRRVRRMVGQYTDGHSYIYGKYFYSTDKFEWGDEPEDPDPPRVKPLTLAPPIAPDPAQLDDFQRKLIDDVLFGGGGMFKWTAGKGAVSPTDDVVFPP